MVVGGDKPGGPATGAILAGGRGSRLGGAKATVELDGRPLISYPLASLAAAGLDAFVVAKPSTELPSRVETADEPGEATDRGSKGVDLLIEPDGNAGRLPAGVEVVLEPEEPVHPLAGILAALRHARRPVVILGCDFPFPPPALLRVLAEAPEPLVVPTPAGEPQPLMARWTPELIPDLEAALAREEPLRRTVAALRPRLLDDAELARFGDPARAFLNVNDPADLRAAARSKG